MGPTVPRGSAGGGPASIFLVTLLLSVLEGEPIADELVAKPFQRDPWLQRPVVGGDRQGADPVMLSCRAN